MDCAKSCRIIGVVLVGLALTACSTVRLAYDSFPRLAYWWIDGYVSPEGAQAERLKSDLAALQAWHRTQELPRVVALLARAESLATRDATPAQACELAEAIRDRVLAVAVQAEPASAELAQSLSDAQREQLARKYDKLDAEYREKWIEPTPERRLQKRFDLFLDRYEDFYGRLNDEQRALLRTQVARSGFDPGQLLAERRERQERLLGLLRGWSPASSRPEVQSALHAWVLAVADPPPGPLRERQARRLEEGCRDLAELHNRTDAAQRERAARKLRSYQEDLRQLAAGA